MRRCDFITLLGGAAAWPLAAHAQQGDPMRHPGVLQPALEHDTEVLIWKTVGWTEGRNLVIEFRRL
jgi:putative ABC transport system substrate-binding protein